MNYKLTQKQVRKTLAEYIVKELMDFRTKLAITGQLDDIANALNAVDTRLVRAGALRRDDSCFRLSAPTRKNDDGTFTSLYSTYQLFAADWLNGLGVSAAIV